MTTFKQFLLIEAQGPMAAGTVTQGLRAVTDGIRKFIRMIPLRQNPMEKKYIQDEYDLLAALETIKEKFHETERMMGLMKYRKTPFDFVDDVKGEMEEWLLNHEEPKEAALQRKRHLVMYHLVLEPLIDVFKNFTHKEALRHVDKIVNGVENMVKHSDVEGNYDDAIVAKEQVRKMIEAREATRKAKLRKKPSRKAKEQKLELPEPDLDFE